MDDVTLIALVEKHSILHDKKRGDYKNKNLQDNVWKSIAAIEEEYVVRVKARWLTLRQRYSRERASLPSGAEATDEWELYKYLKFLDPVVKSRKTFSNLKRPRLESQATSTSSPTCSSNWDSMNEIFSPTEVCEEQFDEGTEEVQIHKSAETYSEVSITPRRELSKKLKRCQHTPETERNNEVIEVLGNTLKGIQTVFTDRKAPDADELFGQFVGARLQLIKNLEVKNKIITDITERLLRQD